MLSFLRNVLPPSLMRTHTYYIGSLTSTILPHTTRSFYHFRTTVSLPYSSLKKVACPIPHSQSLPSPHTPGVSSINGMQGSSFSLPLPPCSPRPLSAVAFAVVKRKQRHMKRNTVLWNCGLSMFAGTMLSTIGSVSGILTLVAAIVSSARSDTAQA